MITVLTRVGSQGGLDLQRMRCSAMAPGRYSPVTIALDGRYEPVWNPFRFFQSKHLLLRGAMAAMAISIAHRRMRLKARGWCDGG